MQSNLRKYAIFFLIIFFLGFFAVKIIKLNDDTLVLSVIKSNPEVYYSNIYVYKIVTMAGTRDILPYYHPEYPTTLLLREFQAYEYPLESVPWYENHWINGYVDWDLNVWVIGWGALL